ncbi:nucleosome assembly protein [Medicago truncatula]|uniref:Nucleosome assembly protein n=1 Tax=Medicago truncatula TaxID=3880 RepID=G7JCV4_MEDTR|nr:nucleosome assembly protein [Medicago truncatula]
MKSLTSFEVIEDRSNESKYSFVFDFEKNDYFEKSKIIKTYSHVSKKDRDENPNFTIEVENDIIWKSDMERNFSENIYISLPDECVLEAAKL